jgi:hypothetical protein
LYIEESQMNAIHPTLIIVASVAVLAGCWRSGKDNIDIGDDTSSDTDADGDLDVDSDTDTDIDSDTDVEDTDSGGDSDSDSDTDSDLEWEGGDCPYTCLDAISDTDILGACTGELPEEPESCPDPTTQVCCILGPGSCPYHCTTTGFCAFTGGTVHEEHECADDNRECCEHDIDPDTDPFCPYTCLSPASLCEGSLGGTLHPEYECEYDNACCQLDEEPCGGVMEGDYEIHNTADLLDLSGYAEVTGNLVIDSTSLSSIDGLECLLRVGGDLTISNNDSLDDITGLASLSGVDGDLTLSGNAVLEDLYGLNELVYVAGSLRFHDMPFESSGGLESLAWIGEWLVIDECDSMVNQGLNSLIAIGLGLRMRWNDSVQFITGLNELQWVGFDIWIEDNDELADLTTLNELVELGNGGNLWILDNPFLPNCHATLLKEQLENNDWFGDVCIYGNQPSDECPDDTSGCP